MRTAGIPRGLSLCCQYGFDNNSRLVIELGRCYNIDKKSVYVRVDRKRPLASSQRRGSFFAQLVRPCGVRFAGATMA